MNSWKEPEIDLIPLFWQYADDGIREVLTAAEDSLKDLFNDLHTRYNALKIQTCEDYKPELMRPMYIRVLTGADDKFPEAVWEKLKPYQRKFFQDRYFLYPSEESGLLWSCLQEMTEAQSLYCGGQYLETGQDFTVTLPDSSGGKAQISFARDPFTVFQGYVTQDEITSPWRTVYQYKQLVLWASDLKMSESVIDTHYTDLIADKSVQKVFRNSESYSVFVYNFYKVLYQGATVEALDAFVNSLSGWAYTLTEGEKVQLLDIAWNAEFEKEMRRVTTDINVYWVPLDARLNPKLVPGVALPQYTPIGESIVVKTYLEDPDWIFNSDAESVGYLDDVITVDGITGGRSWSFDFNTKPPHHPRFDICRQVQRKPGTLAYGDPRRHFQSLEEGLWHNVVGPNLVFINFLDGAVYEKYEELFYNLFLEIAPVHVYCYLTHELTGWFFFDPERTDETGITWFTDEDWLLIEDPEQTDKLYYELSIYHPVAADKPDSEGNIFNYKELVEVLGRAPVGTKIRMWLIDSDSTHAPHLLTDSTTGLQVIEVVGDGVFEFSFEITEDFAPRDATLKLERIIEEGSDMPEWYVTAPIRIIPHALWFTSIPGQGDTPVYALQNHAYTLSGKADENASEGLSVTLTWPHRAEPVPGETIYSVTVQLDHNLEFQYTIPGGDEAQPPVGVYEVRAEIVNGTRDIDSTGEERFTDTPAAVEINCLPTIFHLDTSTQYQGAGLRNDLSLTFPTQPVTPDSTVIIGTPGSGSTS